MFAPVKLARMQTYVAAIASQRPIICGPLAELFAPVGKALPAMWAAWFYGVWPCHQAGYSERTMERNMAKLQAACAWRRHHEVRRAAGEDHVPAEAVTGGEGPRAECLPDDCQLRQRGMDIGPLGGTVRVARREVETGQ